MRLSEWCEQAPIPGCVSAPVMALVERLLSDLGVGPDTDCWVIWGEDPGTRYTILAPSLAGMASLIVRSMGLPDGPRGNGKLTRWSKLNVSELAIESAAGHRVVAIQVDSFVLKGTDEEADAICDFVRVLLAGLENRSEPLAPMVTLAAAPPIVAADVRAKKGRPADRTVASTGAGPVLRDSKPARAVPTVAPSPEPLAPEPPAEAGNEASPPDVELPPLPAVADDSMAAPIDELLEPIDGPAPTREEVAAKRRAMAAALLLPDLGPVVAPGDGSPVAEPAAAQEPAAEPAPDQEPEPAAALAVGLEPVPAFEPPALPELPTAPSATTPPPLPPTIPSRKAWVPPHPIVDAKPVPPKPRRWNP